MVNAGRSKKENVERETLYDQNKWHWRKQISTHKHFEINCWTQIYYSIYISFLTSFSCSIVKCILYSLIHLSFQSKRSRFSSSNEFRFHFDWRHERKIYEARWGAINFWCAYNVFPDRKEKMWIESFLRSYSNSTT